VTRRNRFPHPFRTWSPPIAARHLRGHAALIQKDKPSRVDLDYQFPPRLPPPKTLTAVLFLGVQRFFYAANPSYAANTTAAIG
jgi:hypothetical protein